MKNQKLLGGALAMLSRESRVGVVLALLILALLVAACGQAAAPEPAAVQTVVVKETVVVEASPEVIEKVVTQEVVKEVPVEKVTVRIGYGSDPDFTQVANYKWEEILQNEYGYNVEHFFFESTQVAHKAMLAGAVDVVATGILPAIQASVASEGNRIKVLAADLQSPDYVLVSQPDVKTLKDLEGKRLGISTPGDISDTLSRAVLKREGLDLDKVQVLQIGGTGARMAALAADQIDAGMAHADSGLVAATKGLNLLYAVGNSTQGYLQHGLAATEAWISNNPEVAQNVVNAFMDSVRWAAANREEYIEFSKQYIEDVPDDIRNQAYDIFEQINMFAVDGGLTEENIKTTLDLEMEAGTLEEEVPVELWIDRSFLDKYLAEKGPFSETK